MISQWFAEIFPEGIKNGTKFYKCWFFSQVTRKDPVKAAAVPTSERIPTSPTPEEQAAKVFSVSYLEQQQRNGGEVSDQEFGVKVRDKDNLFGFCPVRFMFQVYRKCQYPNPPMQHHHRKHGTQTAQTPPGLHASPASPSNRRTTGSPDLAGWKLFSYTRYGLRRPNAASRHGHLLQQCLGPGSSCSRQGSSREKDQGQWLQKALQMSLCPLLPKSGGLLWRLPLRTSVIAVIRRRPLRPSMMILLMLMRKMMNIRWLNATTKTHLRWLWRIRQRGMARKTCPLPGCGQGWVGRPSQVHLNEKSG